MDMPVVRGLIERRILANYQVDPDVLARVLPPPFRPKRVNGVGIAGICLIRLNHIRPRLMPGAVGFSSENAAHHIAVEWTVEGQTREGVYVPRRDTTSRLNTWIGGRFFPGVHQHARFQVIERDDYYRVAVDSDDGRTHVCVAGRLSPQLPQGSIFKSMADASSFFEAGSLGYSATQRPGLYDGLELRSHQWKVAPLAVEQIKSSFFENEQVFPKTAIAFDCALIMRGIEHEWHGQAPLCYPTAV